MMHNNKKGDRGAPSTAYKDPNDERIDMRKIMKDIEGLGYKHMSWKEKKQCENKKVVSLGGKPQKSQRLPLSVARVQMKKQKEREQKMLQESMILGRFGGSSSRDFKKREVKRRPEDMALKSTEGHFRNGVLDVKQLLNQTQSKPRDIAPYEFNKGKTQGKGKKKKGKKKGGGKKRH
ncbi:hypothetical protein UlMin_012753 [Ulmus minor]